jgi:SWI/SNF-related matrix-associated actin-dependent regulator of chromatin subfamily A-like protein 1
MKVILTNYEGPCCNCKTHVPNVGPDRGYAVNQNNSWKRYCKTCVPVKIDNKRELTVSGEIYISFERDSLDLLRSIPGAWFDRNKVCWNVSLKDGDRARLLEICDKLKIKVPEELRTVVASEQSSFASESGLYPFQVEGVDWLSKGDHRLLADDMGLGKTIQTLMALPKECAAMVIAPAAVKYNWKQEAEKWRPDLQATVINGSKSFRLPAIGEIVIVNYDILPEYVEPVKISPQSKSWEVKVEWPSEQMANHSKKIILIIDEAQRVKNYKTKRSKRVKGLCMSVSKVWALTGTPLENRPQDLYGILESLQMQMKVFGGWTKFVGHMNGYKDRWGGYVWGTPKPIVPELLRRVMLRRKREEVLPDLPNKKYTYIKCPLPNQLKSEMDILWQTYNSVFKEKELPPFEKFSEIRNKLAISRFDSLIELVEEHEEDNIPLVVFSAHVDPLNKLGEREGWAKITGQTPAEQRQKIVNEFQSGSLKGVAVSIKAGGVGLTLTRAWKAIFVDMDWVPGANQQAEDRICRIGQTSQKVEIVRLFSDHVLDNHVMELISWKMSLIENAIEKSISVDVRHIQNEPEDNFEERMKIASYLTSANQNDENSSNINWPEIKFDSAVPF